MKKILFLALAFVLMASPALAEECPEGEVWQSETTYQNGSCLAYSAPVCEETEWVCNWYGPFGIICWGGWTEQCTSYADPVCESYEQVEVEGGMCVEDTEEPAEETVTSTPQIIAGSLIHYSKPLISWINYTLEGDTIVADVLTTKPMSCGIITSEESQEFAISSDSLPILNSDMELFGSADDLYGYSEMFGQSQEVGTFRTLTAPKANYFRIMCDYLGKPVVSQEYSTIK